MKTGRNDPCPCGSGKKYKQCCLAKQAEPLSSAELRWRRLRRELDDFVGHLLRFTDRAYGSVAFAEAWDTFMLWDEEADPFDPESPHATVFMPWFLYCWTPDREQTEVVDQRLHGVEPARAWLESGPRQVSPMLRAYVESSLERPFSFYEVEQVEPGRGMVLRDLITGTRHDVSERSASQVLRPQQMIYAHLASVDEVTLLEGTGPTALRAEDKVPVIELRKRIRAAALEDARDGTESNLPAAEEWDVELRELYLQLTERLLFPTTPQLVTFDGEPLEFHTLTYAIDSPQAALDALRDLDEYNDDPDAPPDHCTECGADGALERAHVDWTKPDQGPGVQSGTRMGVIDIDGATLTAQLNSRERADRLKGIIASRLGQHARLRADTVESTERMLAHKAAHPVSSAAPLEGPEVEAILTSYLREHYTAWIDLPVPMLGDRTPREVAQTPDGREQVEAMLQGAEHMDGGVSAAARKTIFEDVRRELGLIGMAPS